MRGPSPSEGPGPERARRAPLTVPARVRPCQFRRKPNGAGTPAGPASRAFRAEVRPLPVRSCERPRSRAPYRWGAAEDPGADGEHDGPPIWTIGRGETAAGLVAVDEAERAPRRAKHPGCEREGPRSRCFARHLAKARFPSRKEANIRGHENPRPLSRVPGRLRSPSCLEHNRGRPPRRAPGRSTRT